MDGRKRFEYVKCGWVVFFLSPEASTLKEGFISYNDRVRKGLIANFDRTRPADQCQLVGRVDLWYRSQVKRLF